MKLSSLVQDIKDVHVQGKDDPDIASLHYDSRTVISGGLFFAVPGLKSDGHRFINDAIQRGARGIVSEYVVDCGDIPIVRVQDVRLAMSHIASLFYKRPSAELCLIGITGTNGKTTTAYLTEAILAAAGFRVGVIGTINYRFNGKIYPHSLTTPESIDLHRLLRDMVDSGVSHVVMEVSSHALDLHRVDHCKFDVAAFTNLSQDHLDYHKSMSGYFACKKRLFTELLQTGTAVINADDRWGADIAHTLKALPCITTGCSEKETIWAEDIRITRKNAIGVIHIPGGSFPFQSSLIGRHNIYNMMSATGIGVALNISAETIKTGLIAINSIPGRLEPVVNDCGMFVVVDYAHTPDALEKVLGSLRETDKGRLITVFGCGGDRDKQKRPIMGDIVTRLSDLSVVTSDNPRSESQNEIIKDIISGIQTNNIVGADMCVRPYIKKYTTEELSNGFKEKGYIVIPDRKTAIIQGIKAAQPMDTVLIAGKGHETYQIIGQDIIPFDDRQIAQGVLRDSLC
ncbi:MAG: UDP-N-acetylmuramoyl-L-alanyl-D-glutamate--2,6-diaminopimelate ligase [Pseudomonadota bacterium]